MLETETEISKRYIYVDGFLVKAVLVGFGLNEKGQEIRLSAVFITLITDDDDMNFICFN
jgi:hypothetical protein